MAMAEVTNTAATPAPVAFPGRDTLARTRVLVVGDVMLDRYWYGAVDRISPEAPVPVVRVEREEERLGGAANVALNVRTRTRRRASCASCCTRAASRRRCAPTPSSRPS